MDDVGSSKWWRRLDDWADVIHADFQMVISRYLQNISTCHFCTTEWTFRSIIMKNSRKIQACVPSKMDEVWIDRFCARYDWWRRLQPTSSVSPVWNYDIIIDTVFLNYMNCMTQLVCTSFLLQVTRIRTWIIVTFIENYQHINCKTSLSNYLPFTHIRVYSLCQFSEIGIIWTSQLYIFLHSVVQLKTAMKNQNILIHDIQSTWIPV